MCISHNIKTTYLTCEDSEKGPLKTPCGKDIGGGASDFVTYHECSNELWSREYGG